MKNYKIVVDAMGGDYAPEEVVKGALDALKDDKSLEIVLVGDLEKIDTKLFEEEGLKERAALVDAKDIITNDDIPTVAIKQKKESSLVKAMDIVAGDENVGGLVSAGSTGAVLVGAFMKIGRIKGISRPALAPILPTVKGDQKVILCDCGANIDCKAVNLHHFAIMGNAFAKAMLGVENPRIGLISNGAEEHKGTELNQEVFALLKEDENLNFAGNCEARDLLSGEYDVVVSDGFNGNIALKSTEGAAGAVFTLLKEGITNGGLRAKLGYLLLKPVFRALKKKVDYNQYGGAVFLGCNKVVVKSHGSSKAKAITASILMAKRLAEKELPTLIKEGI
ncbi:MAG: phosphate acyltransferase PlsX [Clostridia bacterium]|nr:phosphate acyltransferase PlsX [Clostridia bacterium]